MKNINTTLSTLNFVLCFTGYQLATSLFLPSSSGIQGISQTVTIPYRAFAFIVSLMVIVINFTKPLPKFPVALKAFLFFWILLIIRIFYDIYFQTNFQIKSPEQLWLYVFGICLPAVFSIIKSHHYIDLEKAVVWIYISSALTLIITLFSNQLIFVNVADTNRLEGNIALNTILYGHLGTTVAILSIYLLLKKSISKKKKIAIVVILILAIFVMLRAGSRGPLVALMLVLFFWIFSFKRKVVNGIILLILTSFVIIVFIDSILDLIGNISPIIESRMRMTIYDNDISEREWFYGKAIEAFSESPIWGKQFAIFRDNGALSYSHNIILDALMGLGVIGGALMMLFLTTVLKKSYTIIKMRDSQYWISLVFMQQFIFSMTSGTIYHDQLLSALLTYLLLFKININRNDIK